MANRGKGIPFYEIVCALAVIWFGIYFMFPTVLPASYRWRISLGWERKGVETISQREKQENLQVLLGMYTNYHFINCKLILSGEGRPSEN